MTTSPELSDDLNLTGKMLIAMPGMQDPRFMKSVVFICAHDSTGTMGLIVNKPSDELKETQLMQHIDVDITTDLEPRPVYFGGPVEMSHGFVLHLDDGRTNASTTPVAAGVAMTATMEILEEIGAGQGPGDYMLALGYAGWRPGQLEGEILENGWLTVEPDAALIFGTPDDEKWSAALGQLGIDPLTLSAAAGRA